MHLIYGAEDWDSIDKLENRPGGKPKRDMVGDDGMRVLVGDASVRIVTTPGHTPGTLSYLFEVRDNGKASPCGLRRWNGNPLQCGCCLL